jgi:hypothetical protein
MGWISPARALFFDHYMSKNLSRSLLRLVRHSTATGSPSVVYPPPDVSAGNRQRGHSGIRAWRRTARSCGSSQHPLTCPFPTNLRTPGLVSRACLQSRRQCLHQRGIFRKSQTSIASKKSVKTLQQIETTESTVRPALSAENPRTSSAIAAVCAITVSSSP